MKEFTSAVEDIAAEDDEDAPEERFVSFKLDGNELHAYLPTDGQLAFMLANLGRGQTKDQRFAAIVNIMMSSLRNDDQDYLESRLLSRDPKKRLRLEMLNGIFEHLIEEWFAHPTQPPSDSASLPQSDGQKSKPRTTKSTS